MFSFCESVAATGVGPWHIRKLGPAGHKFGGGIDTESLCGHVKRGWDLDVKITEHHLGHTCKECVRLYKEQVR